MNYLHALYLTLMTIGYGIHALVVNTAIIVFILPVKFVEAVIRFVINWRDPAWRREQLRKAAIEKIGDPALADRMLQWDEERRKDDTR